MHAISELSIMLSYYFHYLGIRLRVIDQLAKRAVQRQWAPRHFEIWKRIGPAIPA
jgi:hypothetical protein